mmetsp:Transcript_27213/g.62762  ORF Transcript_27213/g.62762 Transcript_27213/m.62762 type:complete len:126 (-) Transcript_27213:233-610(-)
MELMCMATPTWAMDAPALALVSLCTTQITMDTRTEMVISIAPHGQVVPTTRNVILVQPAMLTSASGRRDATERRSAAFAIVAWSACFGVPRKRKEAVGACRKALTRTVKLRQCACIPIPGKGLPP